MERKGRSATKDEKGWENCHCLYITAAKIPLWYRFELDVEAARLEAGRKGHMYKEAESIIG